MRTVTQLSSLSALRAAVRAGAGAVCLSVTDYTKPEFVSEAVKYCRLRDVSIAVAFPQLATDAELLQLKAVIDVANTAGADAAAASDLGVIRILRRLAPDMPIWGGRGLAVHDLAGVMAAQRLGLSGVMLASELSLEQIRFICGHAEIELCADCYGPMCAAYAGQCHMSAAVASRPALRGECTEPCRQMYSYFGDIPAQHLSMKDMSLAAHFRELADAGVSRVCIKANGKRDEYAALCTAALAPAATAETKPERMDMQRLQNLFSREGFSDGYFTGEKGSAMFGIKNEANDREARFVLAEARREYMSEQEAPSVWIDVRFEAHAGREMELFCRDDRGNEVRAPSPAAEPSKNGTSAAEIRAMLAKGGQSVFKIRQVSIDMDERQRVNPAAFGAMRRQCFEALAVRRKAPPERRRGEWQKGSRRLPLHEKPAYTFSFLKTEQITPEILDLAPELVYLPIWRLREDKKIIELLRARKIGVCAVLDRIISDRQWPEVIEALRELKASGLREVLCADIGQPALLAPLGFALRGDFGLNVFNSQSLRAVKDMGLLSCALSLDLNLATIRELSVCMDCELPVYGRMPLMITENCIIKKRNGVHSCQTGNAALIDKTGRSYPLLPEYGCRNTLYNAEKLWLADRRADIEGCGASLFRLCFTTENSKECVQVARAYLENGAFSPERCVRGMYYRLSI